MFRVSLVFAALILLIATPARANDDYPPAQFDVGTRAMSDAAIQEAGNKRAGVRLNYHRVQIGLAPALCNKLWSRRDGTKFATRGENLMGCQIGDDIVYSFDTHARARAKGRQYYADLANRILRHEIGHRLTWDVEHHGGVHFRN